MIFSDGTNAETLKTSVSEGKALIASAVTDKGVQTAGDATFQKIAENILKIGGLENLEYWEYKVTNAPQDYTLDIRTSKLQIPSNKPPLVGYVEWSYVSQPTSVNIGSISHTKINSFPTLDFASKRLAFIMLPNYICTFSYVSQNRESSNEIWTESALMSYDSTSQKIIVEAYDTGKYVSGGSTAWRSAITTFSYIV